MYEDFTDRARKVMQGASEQAQCLNHEYIGTEHILLALVAQEAGVAANVLRNLGANLEKKIRREVERIANPAPEYPKTTKRELPMTPRAKKVIEYAIEEARCLGHNYIGTEHVLLGLVREEEGVAAQVLKNRGVTFDATRQAILSLLGSGYTPPPPRPRPAALDAWPAEVAAAARQLDDEIERLETDKQDAIAAADFEKAALLRDRAHKLNEERTNLLHKWNLDHP